MNKVELFKRHFNNDDLREAKMRGSLKQKQAKLEQDIAAGGEDMRQFMISSGDIVTASLELKKSGEGYAVALRFKSGGSHRRTVGTVSDQTRDKALKAGWDLVRASHLIPRNGWKWLRP